MARPHPFIAREGWLPIAALAAAAATLWTFQFESWLIAFVLAIAVALKFRDPERTIPAEPLGVVSPVDGRVELVETVRDEALGRDAIRIHIRMPFFGAYSARAPVEGRVLDFDGPRGLRIETDEGDDVVLYLNTAPAFGRPEAIVGYGARVGQGQRCGWLRLARVAEVYLPANARVCVAPGRHVLAGSDLLAVLVHGG